MRLLCVLTMLMAVQAVSPAMADIYRWVDADGRVHYSDRPLADNAERVGIQSRPTNPETVAQKSAATQQADAKAAAQASEKQGDQAAAKAVQQDLAKNQAERCKKAQEDYRTAIESHRIYRVGKDGEREYLSSAEIDQARINARKILDDACKPAS